MAQTVVGAALLGAAGTAFLASPGPVSQTAPSLRGGTALPGNSGSTGVAGTAALASLAGVAMAAAAGRRSGATHGKEIPWNLFSPKAPYQGKVVENDFHPQTLTEPTGDANWETTHVTFDHGGKAGCKILSRALQSHAMPCNVMQE
eukprot:s7396_g1.t1